MSSVQFILLVDALVFNLIFEEAGKLQLYSCKDRLKMGKKNVIMLVCSLMNIGLMFTKFLSKARQLILELQLMVIDRGSGNPQGV